MRAAPLLALLRISLLPTAAADALAGTLLAHGGLFPGWTPLLWQAGASLGIYHGALALNDWADREHDARTRPGRPVPSGAIAARTALVVGLLLVASGLACAWQNGHAAAAWMAATAVLALGYTFGGRGPWLGPSLLAACRGANLGAAAFAAGTLATPLPAAAVASYALYVFCVSRLGRHEDGEELDETGAAPRRWLAGARAALLVMAALPWTVGAAWPAALAASALALAASAGLRAHLVPGALGARGAIVQAMGAALRRLLVATAALVLATGTPAAWLGAAAILCGYPLAHALRKLSPPS